MALEEAPGSTLRHKHVKQLMKTEMCKFFMSSSCVKGSRCAYAHSRNEIRDKPDLACTSMCKTFQQTGKCDKPDCSFAHSERELRTTTAFFKTKVCRFAASGRCKHGSDCRFAHDVKELKQTADAPAMTPLAAGFLEEDDVGHNRQSRRTGALARTVRQFTHQRGSSLQGISMSPENPSRLSFDWADLSSDQSTRAETSNPSGSAAIVTTDTSAESGQEAILATPDNTSGDSAEENMFVQSHGGPKRHQTIGEGRRSERKNGEGQAGRQGTTMMITNLPTFLPQSAIVSLFEDLTPCMRGTFDFFYCPWDPQQEQNLGYAIVNFFSKMVASDFQREWSNQPLLGIRTSKGLRIEPAALQGRAANIRHFSGFIFAHHADPRLRPLVRANAKEPLRPMAIAMGNVESRMPQQQQQQQQQRMPSKNSFHPLPSLIPQASQGPQGLSLQSPPISPMADPISSVQLGNAIDGFDCPPFIGMAYPQEMMPQMERQHSSMSNEGQMSQMMMMERQSSTVSQDGQMSQASPPGQWNNGMPGQQYIMLQTAAFPRPAWDQASPLVNRGLNLSDEIDMPQQPGQQCYAVLLPQVAGHSMGVGGPMYDMRSPPRGNPLQERFGPSSGGGGEYSD